MFELIFTIIVIAVIVSKVKAQNQGTNRNNTTYINGKPVKNSRGMTAGGSYRGSYRQPTLQMNHPVQNPWPQAKHPAQASRAKAGQDILSRAKQNVQENNEDLLKVADRMQHAAARGAADTPILTPSGKVAMQGIQPVGQQIGAGFDEDCDIMQRLNDLMIMGYSGNLEFDRDFIAEGVDMLNSYQEFGNNL